MKVLVDYREEKIIPILEKFNIPYEKKNLEVADYIINGIGIERKTITDYINSLVNGRLNNQLYELSRNFDLSYLCIIGYISDGLLHSSISRKALMSSIVGASLKRADDGKMGQVITLVLENDYDFVFFLKFLRDKLEKGDLIRKPTVKPSKKRVSDKDRVLSVIMMFPGISEKRAEAILRHFGSLKDFINASQEELAKVEGIGKKTAEVIYHLINKRFYKNLFGGD